MITPALTLEEQDKAEKYLAGHQKFGIESEYKEKKAPTAIVYSVATIEKLLKANRSILEANAAAIEAEDLGLLELQKNNQQLQESNIYNHAKRELKLLRDQVIAEEGSIDEMELLMQENVMELLRSVVLQRHSGMSISWLLGLFEKLIYMYNLTPITDNPGDWELHGQGNEHEVWQSRRNGAYFSKDGGKTYYDIHSKGAWWARVFPARVRSKFPKKFSINLRALYGKIHKSEPHLAPRREG